MAYTIQINEWQRRVIEQALKNAKPEDLPEVDPSGEWGLFGSENPQTELKYLINGFGRLPEDEQETPGVLHGLCL